jgi:SNF2 family DNA or RNA helicase
MNDNLDELEAQILAQQAELNKKLAELKQQKAILLAKQQEEARRKELEQPVTITFTRFSGNYVFVQNTPYRNDVFEVFRNIPNRTGQASSKENGFPVGEYQTLLTKLKELPNTTITFAPEVEAKINDYLYAPNFQCDIEARYFVIRTARKAYTYPLRQIPGHNFDYTRELHTIPLSEGWRLYEFAKTEESNFVWTDEAKEFVIKQIENRLLLDNLAKAEDTELEIPELKANLKKFQKVGIKFFELNGGRGILADEMGTGKTLQMIGLIVHNKYKALVICPATLKENWLREIRKFAPQLTTYTCQGEVPLPYDIAAIISKKPDIVLINYDIFGTHTKQTYDEVKKDGNNEYVLRRERDRWPWVEVLNLVGFDIVVLDEAHYIKNVDSKRSQAARRIDIPRAISLTGTPILNRPGELWPMLHLADPITFPAFETFKNQYTFDGKTVRNVEELKALLKPLMIRRLKKDVIKELPPVNRINSYFELSDKGRKLYDRVLAGVFEVLAEWSPTQAGDSKKVTHILAQIQRLKQVVAIDAVEGTADLATQIYDNSPEGEENKVLIFSQFKATTFAISRRLGQEALSFVSLTPSKEFSTLHYSEQQKLIDQFQADPNVHFLCVTEKTAKEGHNITAAKAVIFNDLFWTPAGHQQAEGRAYGRISDLHTIDSYYRIGVNSISEKIMEILAAKLSLIEQTIEGVNAIRADESIVKELLATLKDELWSLKKGK